MASERWRDIPRWEGLYQVSDQGRVRSLDRIVPGRSGPTRYKGKVLKAALTGNGKGYPWVSLVMTGAGRKENWYVHDLVLLTFVGSKPPGLEVCHENAVKTDARLRNLRYDTRSANARDRWANHVHQTYGERRARERAYRRKWRQERRRKGLPVT